MTATPIRTFVFATSAALAAALGACSTQHREMLATAACPPSPAGHAPLAAHGAVAEPYFGAEFAEQQMALNARPIEVQPEAF